MRWKQHGWAIAHRHRLLAAEMALRGYRDNSPVRLRSNKEQWPSTYIDDPQVQLDILKEKYIGKEPGRIPLPKTAQELWEQHKFSVLARDKTTYKRVERTVFQYSIGQDFSVITKQFTIILRERALQKGIHATVLHMWCNTFSSDSENTLHARDWSPQKLLKETQKAAITSNENNLISSTTLSELESWLY